MKKREPSFEKKLEKIKRHHETIGAEKEYDEWIFYAIESDTKNMKRNVDKRFSLLNLKKKRRY